MIESLLESIESVTVGVLGDFSLDAYWDLDRSREELSVETWLPVNVVKAQRYSLGGAGNVVANLTALGVGRVRAFGVIGDDLFGRELVAQLGAIGVETGGLVVQAEGWESTVFAKPHVDDEEQRRFDFGTYNAIAPQTESRLIETLEAALDGVDVLIVNQQIPSGWHSARVIDELNRLIAARPDRLFLVDSRHKCQRFSGAVLKLNDLEAAAVCGESRDPNELISDEDVERYASVIQQRTGRSVIVTLGERGMLVRDGAVSTTVAAPMVEGETDTVGAGDTATSALAACLGAGASCADATRVASLAAAVTVKKLRQCGTASADEILALADR